MHSSLQDYVNAFAVCLMRCNGNDKSPAYGRLLQLLAETRALKLTFCMLRPVRCYLCRKRVGTDADHVSH